MLKSLNIHPCYETLWNITWHWLCVELNTPHIQKRLWALRPLFSCSTGPSLEGLWFLGQRSLKLSERQRKRRFRSVWSSDVNKRSFRFTSSLTFAKSIWDFSMKITFLGEPLLARPWYRTVNNAESNDAAPKGPVYLSCKVLQGKGCIALHPLFGDRVFDQWRGCVAYKDGEN